MDTETTVHPDEETLKAQCFEIGTELGSSLEELLREIGGTRSRTGEFAKVLGIDKVLASRALKTARAGDPLAILHVAPGPDPLRRIVQAADSKGAPKAVVDRTRKAVSRFERLIRENAGDRSGLTTLLSAWLPEARREFELRRKQSAYRAMSEIRGSSAETTLATVLLHPSESPGFLDVVWLFGVIRLRRTRPGAQIRLTSRRVANTGSPRRPMTLDRERVDDLRGLRLTEFCSTPPVGIDVHDTGEVVHYTVARDLELLSEVDLVFAEVNLAEIEDTLKPGATRSAYFFSEISIPTRQSLFDVLVHEDVYRTIAPRLLIYDTAFEGIASVNDRSRDLDVLDLDESLEAMGTGVDHLRTSAVPRYAAILDSVFHSLGWDAGRFRGYRSRIDFPIYGTQITISFDPPVSR
ncbi:MAG: hypothetical protein R3E12_04115 [Candidatus Eisenbacteria bacterium]